VPEWAQVLGIVIPVIVAVLGWVGSRNAQKIAAESAKATASKTAELEREKVDREAFGRAQAIYENAIQRLEKQAESDRVVIERTAAQLEEAHVTIERQRALLEEYERRQRRTDAEMTILRQRLTEVEASQSHDKDFGGEK
jgi:hypothetical protein